MIRHRPRAVLPALLSVLLLLVAGWARGAELHLIFNADDADDHYPADAGITLAEARDGAKPDAIESDAERYFVQMPEGSTTNVLGLPVEGEEAGGAGTASAQMTGAARAAAGADEGDTGWIELEASVASVYYWSESGEGESDWRVEEPRLFIRRFADGGVVVAIGRPGSEPPSDDLGGAG